MRREEKRREEKRREEKRKEKRKEEKVIPVRTSICLFSSSISDPRLDSSRGA
jgi:hypothetical protein